MKKLFCLSIYTMFSFVFGILFGCNTQKNTNDLKEKTINEFHEEIKNTKFDMELIIDNYRATCSYANDSQLYVFSIKYENNKEYGYIYDSVNHELYNIDNGYLKLKSDNTLKKNEMIEKLLSSSCLIYYINHDLDKFEFIEQTIIANRDCNKYRYITEHKGKEMVYNIYIDIETQLCLKTVCSHGDNIEFYFEAKKFENNPSLDSYKEMISSIKEETEE